MATPESAIISRLGGGKNIGVQRPIQESFHEEQQRSNARQNPRGTGLTSSVPSKKVGTPTQQEKLGGVFWWLMLGLMVFSDIGTALCNILVTVGLSLTATVVGSIIGIPLAVLGYGASLLISLNAFMFSMGYYWTNKVPLLEARKLATLGVSVIIKGIPYGNLLPTLTISFVVVTLMENAKRGSGIIGAVAKKVVAKAGPVGAIAGNVLSKA